MRCGVRTCDLPIYYLCFLYFFFFNDTATTEIYTLSLHDALPILTHQKSLFIGVYKNPLIEEVESSGILIDVLQNLL